MGQPFEFVSNRVPVWPRYEGFAPPFRNAPAARFESSPQPPSGFLVSLAEAELILKPANSAADCSHWRSLCRLPILCLDKVYGEDFRIAIEVFLRRFWEALASHQQPRRCCGRELES